MAHDWIKMRVNLVTHPKVISLAEFLGYNGDYQDWSGLQGFIPAIGGSKKDFDDGVMQALRVTRYVTVTALLKFWGYANEHAKDEFIPSLRISDIDEITQVPGFGESLESVGWAEYDEELKGVKLPNFSEHNATASDRGSAERQKRYREKKKAQQEKSDVTRDITALHREEKRREEKKEIDTNNKQANPTEDFFSQAWNAYPKRPGASRRNALKAWEARIKAGVSPSTLIDGVEKYASYCVAMQIEPKFIKSPETFFGPGEHYLSDWTPAQGNAHGKNGSGRGERISSVIAELTGRTSSSERVINGVAERVD